MPLITVRLVGSSSHTVVGVSVEASDAKWAPRFARSASCGAASPTKPSTHVPGNGEFDIATQSRVHSNAPNPEREKKTRTTLRQVRRRRDGRNPRHAGERRFRRAGTHPTHPIAAIVNGQSMDALFRFPTAAKRDPLVESWLRAQRADLRPLVQTWFARMRRCGDDVRELMHDGAPTACVGDADFAYVNAFRDHVNVGFFFGAVLDDPARLLEGTGKRMRHVKLRPGREVDPAALAHLIEVAYADVRRRRAD